MLRQPSSLSDRRNKKLPPAPLATLDSINLTLDPKSPHNASKFSNIRIEQVTPSQVTPSQTDFRTPNDHLLQPKSLKRKNLKHLKISGRPAENSQTPDARTPTELLILTLSGLDMNDLDTNKIFLNSADLLTLKTLGAGSSGTVSKVLHLPTKQTMAKKIIHIDATQTVQTQIVRELRIMGECNLPYIIGFFGLFLSEGHVIICMEYIDCGSLDKVLRLSGPFPEFMLKQVCYCVLQGLIYLYDTHKIIHRDVKPSNVLVNSRGEMKLCDFGVSRELINSLADTFVGTSTYMSPERIQGGVYSIKGDVWSLGLMLIELAAGSFPFGDNSTVAPEGILDLLQSIVNEEPPTLDRTRFSAPLCDFVDCCLRKEKQRSGPWELLDHPFLQGMSDGVYDKEIRAWAKKVRRIQKGKV
ncbi:hypothetical protein BABINDRAFT_163016 [Babjeviella inositovora NRRL Y-12698]|uniref:mitogen-activated protein kinase kinase n=1 Tax=Babjeviella inositovora NRRL Y-12698 TaxID=984486 RepID=A0A1E3QJU4_9ASCO|nr:uncharacterized protein BABINDRAFT_163016 [Babjeviella inositovora NRRL Y-12698]ODQ77965.1 hypothetical protein BABINDRAFT_163016 [Babjeviella inositovora NRRL Y-12698]